MLFLNSFLVSSLLFLSQARATTVEHRCVVAKSIQTVNKETSKNQFFHAATAPFAVTRAAHEDAYEVPILAKDGSQMGLAKVDTGTLMGTAEGDLIQAHAYVDILGQQEYLGLVASTKSPMARSHRFFTSESEKELIMINIHLQCGLK